MTRPARGGSVAFPADEEHDMSEQAPAIAGIAALAVDCHDPATLARWWNRLLDGEVEVDADGDATLRTADGLAIDFLRVPEAKTVKNRLHLDLRSRDLAEATSQALALGATRADDIYDGGRWQVLRDPEGNEFCLLRPR
jgi:Glyoxalase-like domain